MNKLIKKITFFTVITTLLVPLIQAKEIEASQRQWINCVRFVNTQTLPLNVRRNMSFDNNVIGTVPRGAKVNVSYAQISGGTRWARISLGNISGYVDSNFLSFSHPVRTRINGTRFVNVATNLHFGSSRRMRHTPVQQIGRNMRVHVDYAVWVGGERWASIWVYHSDITGYVLANYLRV